MAAHEIMLGTSAIRNLIREAKVAQMYSTIQTSNSVGMQTLDQNLTDLVRRNIISPAEAAASQDARELSLADRQLRPNPRHWPPRPTGAPHERHSWLLHSAAEQAAADKTSATPFSSTGLLPTRASMPMLVPWSAAVEVGAKRMPASHKAQAAAGTVVQDKHGAPGPAPCPTAWRTSSSLPPPTAT